MGRPPDPPPRGRDRHRPHEHGEQQAGERAHTVAVEMPLNSKGMLAVSTRSTGAISAATRLSAVSRTCVTTTAAAIVRTLMSRRRTVEAATGGEDLAIRTISGAKSRAAMMSISAGVIRLTTARASCQVSSASELRARRVRIASPQAIRFTVCLAPGARCPGRAVASSTPSISSRWTWRCPGG